MVGHSFGAATAVEVLRNKSRMPWVSQGIIYDVWAGGIKQHFEDEETTSQDSRTDPPHRIKCPILAINSEAFSYWKANFDAVRSLVDEVTSEPSSCPAWLITVRGTIHVNQSDFALLYKHTCSLFLKMAADPKRALDININASLEFLKLVAPPNSITAMRASPAEGLLSQAAIDLDRAPSADLHRPDTEFIAAKLKIPHEIRYRLSPRLAWRGHKRKKQGGNPGLEGMGDPDREVWIHVAPTKEDLKAFGVETLVCNDGEKTVGESGLGLDSDDRRLRETLSRQQEKASSTLR